MPEDTMPRYTTNRLRLEIKRATEARDAEIASLRAENERLVDDLKRANELINAGLDDYRSAREAAIAEGMERAAVIAAKWEGKPCGTAESWTEEQRQFYDAGQFDASSSIEFAIRAAKEVTK